MSRRRRPPVPGADMGRPQVQLVCTGRGQHKRTHLGWLSLSLASERPREVGQDVDEPDWLFFSVDRYNSEGSGLEEKALQVINRHTGAVYWGGISHPDDSTIRRRFTPTQLCDRCRTDAQMTEERLVRIVREARECDIPSLDISRMG